MQRKFLRLQKEKLPKETKVTPLAVEKPSRDEVPNKNSHQKIRYYHLTFAPSDINCENPAFESLEKKLVEQKENILHERIKDLPIKDLQKFLTEEANQKREAAASPTIQYQYPVGRSADMNNKELIAHISRNKTVQELARDQKSISQSEQQNVITQAHQARKILIFYYSVISAMEKQRDEMEKMKTKKLILEAETKAYEAIVKQQNIDHLKEEEFNSLFLQKLNNEYEKVDVNKVGWYSAHWVNVITSPATPGIKINIKVGTHVETQGIQVHLKKIKARIMIDGELKIEKEYEYDGKELTRTQFLTDIAKSNGEEVKKLQIDLEKLDLNVTLEKLNINAAIQKQDNALKEACQSFEGDIIVVPSKGIFYIKNWYKQYRDLLQQNEINEKIKWEFPKSDSGDDKPFASHHMILQLIKLECKLEDYLEEREADKRGKYFHRFCGLFPLPGQISKTRKLAAAKALRDVLTGEMFKILSDKGEIKEDNLETTIFNFLKPHQKALEQGRLRKTYTEFMSFIDNTTTINSVISMVEERFPKSPEERLERRLGQGCPIKI